MMSDIETAFVGSVGRVPELRMSKAGKPWAFFPVAVGKEAATQWVKLTVFGQTAEALCKNLAKGDRIYAEGRLTASVWTPQGGEPRVQIEVAAFKCERLNNIGRNKPKREPNDQGGNSGHERPYHSDDLSDI